MSQLKYTTRRGADSHPVAGDCRNNVVESMKVIVRLGEACSEWDGLQGHVVITAIKKPYNLLISFARGWKFGCPKRCL